MYIHNYDITTPETSDENLRSILMIYTSSACATNSVIEVDIINWSMNSEKVKVLPIRVYNEYLKVER